MQQIVKEKSNLFNGVKIIIATSLYPPEIDRVAFYCKNLAERLSQKDQVTVLTYAGPVEKPSKFDLGIVNKHWPLLFRLLAYTYKLYFLAKKADIIYAQNSVAVTLPAIIVKSLLKIPVVINFSEDEAYKRATYLGITDKSLPEFLINNKLDKQTKRIKNLQAWILPRATRIVVPSQALQSLVEKFYKVSKQKIVINYPVADAPIVLPFDQSVKKNQVLVFGRDFAWISQEAMNDLDLVVLAGKSLSKAEVSYLIKTSALIVYSVASENYDNFLIDCVALGKNILAHDTAYAQEIIGQSGFLADFSNKQAVMEKIHQLLKGKVENKNTENKFDWESHLNKLQDIFQASIKK
jgi:glycosyltransferase involved in cell wall biosynthesis